MTRTLAGRRRAALRFPERDGLHWLPSCGIGALQPPDQRAFSHWIGTQST